MNHTKSLIFNLLFFLFVSSASAVSPVNKTLLGGLAIKGYDPVSYFVSSKPQKGKSEFQFKFNGAKWRFVSAENLKKFEKEPEKYMPQYGGYCAWAVSQGYTASIDPKSWKILNEKLYLNYNQSIQDKWEKETKVFIQKADVNWPKILEDK